MATVSAWPAVLAGLVAALVGFGSSFAIVLQGLSGVGANPAEAASGLLAVTLAMGLLGVGFGLATRIPVAIAWSTPGAALLAATGPAEGGFAAAVGAFLVCGVMIVVAGLWRPFGRAVLAIPGGLANAMLAGVLLGLCVAPFDALVAIPTMAAPVVVVWALVARFARLYAAPAAVATALVMVGLYAPLGRGLLTSDIADPATLAEGDTRKRQPRYAGDNLAHNRALAQKVEAIAKRKGCTPAQLALAWVLAQGTDVIPIPGTKQKKRLLENIGALNVNLSESELAEISSAVPAGAVKGTRYPEGQMASLYI